MKMYYNFDLQKNLIIIKENLNILFFLTLTRFENVYDYINDPHIFFGSTSDYI